MFTLGNTTRKPQPGLPFELMKKALLGEAYALSLVFVGDGRARTLNLTYRQKNSPANILSFPLGKKEGEIFINLARARREHRKFDLGYEAYVGYLFIHGLLHLKGYPHGSTMEAKERLFMKRFNLHEQAHRHRT